MAAAVNAVQASGELRTAPLSALVQSCGVLCWGQFTTFHDHSPAVRFRNAKLAAAPTFTPHHNTMASCQNPHHIPQQVCFVRTGHTVEGKGRTKPQPLPQFRVAKGGSTSHSHAPLRSRLADAVVHWAGEQWSASPELAHASY